MCTGFPFGASGRSRCPLLSLALVCVGLSAGAQTVHDLYDMGAAALSARTLSYYDSQGTFRNLSLAVGEEHVLRLHSSYGGGTLQIKNNGFQVEDPDTAILLVAVTGNGAAWTVSNVQDSGRTDRCLFGTLEMLPGAALRMTCDTVLAPLTVDSVSIESSSHLTVGNSLRVHGDWANANNTEPTAEDEPLVGFQPGLNPVSFAGVGRTVSGFAGYVVQIPTGSDVTVTDLVLDSGDLPGAYTTDVLTVDGRLRVTGDWSGNGLFTPGPDGVVEFSGSQAQTLIGAGVHAFTDLVVRNQAGVTAVDDLVVTRTLAVEAGRFHGAGNLHHVTIAADGTLSAAGDLTVSGDWVCDGLFEHHTHQVVFDGAAGPQELRGAVVTTFHNLHLAMTGDSAELRALQDVRVEGEWRNDAAFDAVTAQTRVTFAGTATDCAIAGTGGTTFFDLGVDLGDRTLRLLDAREQVVLNLLSLDSGEVRLGESNLRARSLALPSQGSGGSVVTDAQGALFLEVGVDPVVFPVRLGLDAGSAGFVPATLALPGRVPDWYGVRVTSPVTADGIGGGDPVSTDLVRVMWILYEDTAGGSDLDLAFQWNQAPDGTGEETAGFDRSLCTVTWSDGAGYWYWSTPPGPAETVEEGVHRQSSSCDLADRDLTAGVAFTVRGEQTTLPPAAGFRSRTLATQQGVLVEWVVQFQDGVTAYEVQRLDDAVWVTVGVLAPTPDMSYSLVDPDGVDVGLYRIVAVTVSGFRQVHQITTPGRLDLTLVLEPGWNLLSLPYDNADLSALDQALAPGYWVWDQDRYRLVATPAATQGFWAYAPAAAQVQLSGVPRLDSVIELRSGWNLVGPLAGCGVPDGPEAVFAWKALYRSVRGSDDQRLSPTLGYWFYSSVPRNVGLP